MFHFDVPAEIVSFPSQPTCESKKNEPPAPERGTDGGRRNFSESEQMWRSRKIHVPELIEVEVPGTNRRGKAWI